MHVGHLPDDKYDDETMALEFGHSRRRTEVSIAELEYFAGKAGLPEWVVLDLAQEIVHRQKVCL